MKKTIPLLIVLLIAVCFAACKSKTVETHPATVMETPAPAADPTADPEKIEPDQVLTLNYVLEHTSLTEADFEGIDFNDFAEKYGLTIQSLNKYEIGTFLRMYKEDLNTVTLDYSYIFNNNTDDKLTKADFDHINAIVWKYNEGIFVDSMIIDILKGEAYSGTGWDCELIYKYGELDSNVTTFKWTDDLTERVKEYLLESGIVTWDKMYDGENIGTGNFVQSIAFLLDDGRTIAYHDNGMTSKAPEEMFELIENLKSLQTIA